MIPLRFELVRQFAQPRRYAVRFNVLERLAVHPRCALIESAALIGNPQYVLAIHLVIQRIEAISGRSLRFGV